MRRSLAFALVLGTACATSTPVGVERMDAREVDRDFRRAITHVEGGIEHRHARWSV